MTLRAQVCLPGARGDLPCGPRSELVGASGMSGMRRVIAAIRRTLAVFGVSRALARRERHSPFRCSVPLLGRDPRGAHGGGQSSGRNGVLEGGPARLSGALGAEGGGDDPESGSGELAMADGFPGWEPRAGLGCGHGDDFAGPGGRFSRGCRGRTGTAAGGVHAAALCTRGPRQRGHCEEFAPENSVLPRQASISSLSTGFWSGSR